MKEYEKLVKAGTLRSDDYQTQIIEKLQALHDALVVYDPQPSLGAPSLVNTSFFTIRFILR
jgi:protein AFG1